MDQFFCTRNITYIYKGPILDVAVGFHLPIYVTADSDSNCPLEMAIKLCSCERTLQIELYTYFILVLITSTSSLYTY